MEKQLARLNFEQAKRAYSLGFNYPVYAVRFDGIDQTIPAPENALFLQWARKTKEMHGLVYPDQRENMEGKWAFSIECLEDGSWGASSGMEGLFDTYPQAETALVDEILNILEKQ
jgi:hypothetical protein